MKLKRVLFPTDFSPCSNHALVHAAHLAVKNDAELHILHVVTLFSDDPQNPTHKFPDDEELKSRLEDSVSGEVEGRLQKLPVHSDRVTRLQMRGVSVAPTILGYAADQKIDLIVMGTHGRRGLSRMVLGSVVEKVVRLAPCPVLSLQETDSEDPVDLVSKILVPVDFSNSSETQVPFALSLAKDYGASIELLHVIEEPVHPSFYVGGVTPSPTWESLPSIRKRSKEALEELLGKQDLGSTKVECVVTEGYPAQSILDIAEERKCGMIVLATHGLAGMAHFLLGSVAEKVIRHSPIPVFTVKAKSEGAL